MLYFLSEHYLAFVILAFDPSIFNENVESPKLSASYM